MSHRAAKGANINEDSHPAEPNMSPEELTYILGKCASNVFIFRELLPPI